MNYQDIRDLVSHNEIDNALTALLNLAQEDKARNQRFRDDLIILSQRFEKLKHKENSGELSLPEIRQENAAFMTTLLSLMQEMETGKPAQEPLAAPRVNPANSPNRGKGVWLYVLLGVGLLAVVFWLSQRGGGTSDGNKTVDPPPGVIDQIVDINGIWPTNHPPLTYRIDQNGRSYTWRVVGAPDSGTGRIEGDNIISTIGGREVVYFVNARFPDGRPSELRTHDAQFSGIVLIREQ